MPWVCVAYGTGESSPADALFDIRGFANVRGLEVQVSGIWVCVKYGSESNLTDIVNYANAKGLTHEERQDCC